MVKMNNMNLKSNVLKNKLRLNQVTLGSWITLNNPAIAEIMSNAGFDWLTIDLEHSVIDYFETENLIRTIELSGVSPLIRLSSNDPIQIKRVMDAGAHGIIVPVVNTAEQAQAAVDAMYYPTRGKRGVGLARAQGYGSSFEDYCDWLGDNAIIIVQIEHIDAVNNIEEILDTPHIDGLILGPYDLSASMGKPGKFEDKDVQESIDYVLKMANKKSMPSGIHIIEPNVNELKMRIDMGFKFLAYSLDVRMLDAVSREGINIKNNLCS